MLYLCFFKPLRDHLRGFLIAAWAGDKIAEFSFPEISFYFPLRPWFFFVSPAYAGKSQTAGTPCSSVRDHPRMCGEKLWPTCPHAPNAGSPPRMRGKVRIPCWRSVSAGDHPRMCGEKGLNPVLAAYNGGSPPHVRGKVPPACCFCPALGITPACAGKRLLYWKNTFAV